MLENSSLSNAACATETLNILSKFCVLTRLSDHENSNLYSKMRVYDGETIKDSDPRAKSLQEYRDAAGVDEGMSGISTRFAFKILSKTFNFDPAEVAADPVHLMFVMEQAIKQEQFGEDRQAKFINFIKEYLAPKYAEQLGTEIQKAYLESYSDYGQNLFNRYIEYADAWIQEIDYKDPDTGNLFDRTILNKELEKVEKAAGISNPKDFRNEVVNFVIRATAKNGGQVVKWTSYEKLREVIEKKMFASTEELLPIISFAAKSSNDDQKKHDEFVSRMMEKGYTEKQVKRLVEWYMRTQKSS
jgi:serine protein kinase